MGLCVRQLADRPSVTHAGLCVIIFFFISYGMTMLLRTKRKIKKNDCNNSITSVWNIAISCATIIVP